MPGRPSTDLFLLVGGIAIEDDMDGLVRRQFSVEELDKLLMAMALHVAPDDGAIEHVQRREQHGCAVALVVVGMVAPRPRLSGRPGWVRSSAWIWLFSSTDSTIAWAGGKT